MLASLYRESRGDASHLRVLVAELAEYIDTLVEDEFKRRIRLVLAVCAIVIVVGLNIDTIYVAQVFWDNATPAGQTGQALVLPIGGVTTGSAATPSNVGDVFVKIVGLLLTVGAVSLGADFGLGCSTDWRGYRRMERRKRRRARSASVSSRLAQTDASARS